MKSQHSFQKKEGKEDGMNNVTMGIILNIRLHRRSLGVEWDYGRISTRETSTLSLTLSLLKRKSK